MSDEPKRRVALDDFLMGLLSGGCDRVCLHFARDDTLTATAHWKLLGKPVSWPVSQASDGFFVAIKCTKQE